MACKEWKIRVNMRKAKSFNELVEYISDEFSNVKILNIIREKIKLLRDNPFKYAREKLGKDRYGNPMFSIEVTGDIRILYSVDSKNCIVFIWEIGSHKRIYGH
ncbi:type II toxin-antitoxin system RelE family toxin [Sulfurisphaera ohwakuensis]|uniref:Type II toxin-antitoxin system RelE/ParE family toxin n=1 Tax=Sulfurisphaera ohwakuensis TaxID=69656 RepID=A0A650CHH9_SULOH|nr:mRNA-degrading endonuclease RelE of RelBE toxin-antitoxin system [Sulfurisphaera ohwakuensis]QGR17262.1 type II toxin-antitoxin system RelE/ParE family toxin [Sulfurisphaera ohwakuensis]